MEHFNQKIHGWCNFQSLYQEMVQKANDNSHFVEIGSWKGKSASYMCVEIINSKKKIKFDCVDTWKGSEEHQKGGDFEDKDIINGTLFETFTNNMKPVEGVYNPIRLPSLEAAKLYEDESLDFVFIDASHDYENVKADVLAWLPKIKSGKFLAGDDYKGNEVAQAVHEILGNKVTTKGSDWPSWFYMKE
jgi:hypothetical protein